MAKPAELRTVNPPPDLAKKEFSSRYFGAAMAHSIIHHLANHVGRWNILEQDTVYPRPQLRYEMRNENERKNPFFAGISFSPESETDLLDFFDAVWNFIQSNMDEMLSFAGQDNTTILDNMLLKLIPQFELGLENNTVFKAFSGIEQIREQDGAVKRPYAHSLKVLRNVIRQNLFKALPDFSDDHPLRRFIPGNRHPVIFLSLFKAMTHDIGNLFFLDQDKLHFHALFSANVLYEYLVKRRGMPPLLAYSLTEDVDGHHIFEASAMHRIDGPGISEHFIEKDPDVFLALAILGIADVSTTKRMDLEIENLREQIMICIALPGGEKRNAHAKILINRIIQLITLINEDPETHRVDDNRQLTTRIQATATDVQLEKPFAPLPSVDDPLLIDLHDIFVRLLVMAVTGIPQRQRVN